MTVQIVVAADALPAERRASKVLNQYLVERDCGLAVNILIGSAAERVTSFDRTDAFQVAQTPSASGLEVRITGSGNGVLYGAYAWLERQGWSFHVSGDVEPETWLPARGAFRIERSPRFAWRGLQLWNYWWPGRDSWGFAEYKSYLDQFPKLGLNQFEFPLYWYEPLFTGVKFNGRDMLRPPLSGCDVGLARVGDQALTGRGRFSSPDIPVDASPAERHAAALDLMRRVFDHAKQLGLRTVAGIELGNVLLIDPRLLNELPSEDRYEGGRLVQPSSPSGRALAKARIEAFVQAFPTIDVYAIWQSEMGPWRSTAGSPHPDDVAFRERYSAYQDRIEPGDFDQLQWLRLASEYAEGVKPGARLATGGWGAERLMIAADEILPDSMVRATIADYEPEFGLRRGAFAAYEQTKAERWHTTWAEVDQHLWIEQTKIAATRRVLDELEKRGVEGVAQLHWRRLFPDPDLHAFRLGCWTGTGTAADARLSWATAKFGEHAAPDVVAGLEAFEAFNAEIVDRSPDILHSAWWVGFDCYMGALLHANRFLNGQPLADLFIENAVRPLLEAAPILDAHLDGAAAAFAAALSRRLTEPQRARLGFWANRARYSRDLHRAQVELAKAVQLASAADGISGWQAALDIVDKINPEAIVAAFAERLGERDTPDAGELGLLLTLNIKFIGSVRRIAGALERLITPVKPGKTTCELSIEAGGRVPHRPYGNFFELLHGQAGPWAPELDTVSVKKGFGYTLLRGGAGRMSPAAAMWSDPNQVEIDLTAPPGWEGTLDLYFYQEPDWDAAFRHLSISIDDTVVDHVRDFHGRGQFHDEGVWRSFAVRFAQDGRMRVKITQLGSGDARISGVILRQD
ncbi:hypothetical protein [Hyphomonas sp.]|jgi:hypothetical protein|uniref:hypothetical protein n=1 Tax=Hyphomonas sp. TaxID=87 RepID=UPI0037BE6008